MSKLPERDWKDHSHSIIKAAISAAPYVGGPLSVMLETVFTPPLEKRREKWFEELSKTVDSLLENGYPSIEALASNEQFITATIKATSAAIRTNHIEKIEALKAALKNTALDVELNESRNLIFIEIIDEFTPLHFRLLKFFERHNNKHEKLNESVIREMYNYGTYKILSTYWDEEHGHPKSSDPILNYAVSRLIALGLVVLEDDMLTSRPMQCLTLFGREFLAFISTEKVANHKD